MTMCHLFNFDWREITPFTEGMTNRNFVIFTNTLVKITVTQSASFPYSILYILGEILYF